MPVNRAAQGYLVDGDLFLKAARRRPLSARAHGLITDGAQPRFLSVVSVWRLLMQERAGLELLPSPVATLLQGERSVLGLESLALDEECLIHMESLNELHLSPWDQLIICQALHHNLILLSDRPELKSPAVIALPVEVVS